MRSVFKGYILNYTEYIGIILPPMEIAFKTHFHFSNIVVPMQLNIYVSVPVGDGCNRVALNDYHGAQSLVTSLNM